MCRGRRWSTTQILGMPFLSSWGGGIRSARSSGWEIWGVVAFEPFMSVGGGAGVGGIISEGRWRSGWRGLVGRRIYWLSSSTDSGSSRLKHVSTARDERVKEHGNNSTCIWQAG